MPLVFLEPGECREIFYRPSRDHLWMVSLAVRVFEDLRPEPSRQEPKIRARIYEGVHAMREEWREALEAYPVWKAAWAAEYREWHEAVGRNFTLMLGVDCPGVPWLMRIENLSTVSEVVEYVGTVAQYGLAPPRQDVGLTLEELSRATSAGVKPLGAPAKKSVGDVYAAMMKSAAHGKVDT